MVRYAKIVTDKIRKSKYRPDLIVAVSRGGLVPARILCDLLVIKNCLSMKVDHWGITATKDGKAKISYGLNISLSGKKVLLVDDITDTGQSMEISKLHLLGLNPDKLKTATLIHLTNSKYVPDYYGHEREWAWIVFPWNMHEDLVNLIKKLGYEGKTTELIQKELKKKFDLDASSEEIQDSLERIKYLELA